MSKILDKYQGEIIMLLAFIVAGVFFFHTFIVNSESFTFFTFVMLFCSFIYSANKAKS